MSTVFNSLNGAKWIETASVEMLKQVVNPSLGNRHVPVNHGEVLETFMAKAESQGLSLSNSGGYLSPAKDKFIFVAEVLIEKEMAYSIGFMNFNDRSRAFTGLAGERVICHANLCFGGVFNPSRTRHTTYVEERLDDKVESIFDCYNDCVEKMKTTMGFLKEREVDDASLGKVLVDLHRSEMLGATNIQRVIQEFDSPKFEDGDTPNGWQLQNAFAHVLKKVKNPIVNIDTGNIGRELVLKSLGY